jgi:hypothetical protein
LAAEGVLQVLEYALEIGEGKGLCHG